MVAPRRIIRAQCHGLFGQRNAALPLAGIRRHLTCVYGLPPKIKTNLNLMASGSACSRISGILSELCELWLVPTWNLPTRCQSLQQTVRRLGDEPAKLSASMGCGATVFAMMGRIVSTQAG